MGEGYSRAYLDFVGLEPCFEHATSEELLLLTLYGIVWS
jgi:hypothetical protein